MKIFTLSAFVDAVISCVLCFFAAFTVLISFKIYRPSAALFSVVAAAALAFAVYFLSARRKSNALLQDRTKAVKQCMDIFNVCTYGENLAFFASAFNKMGISASVTNEHISLGNGKKAVPFFYPSPITDNMLKALADRIRINGDERIIVLSSGFTANALAYAKCAYISVFGAKDVFELLNKHDLLPEIKATVKKRRYFPALTGLFVKNNGVRFILFGLSLIIMAFVVFYPLYYYIAGAVFILFGMVSLIFAKPVKRVKTDLSEDLFN